MGFSHLFTSHDMGTSGSLMLSGYNAGKVVYQPKHMSPERLAELYQYAWDTFYKDEPQTQKMFNLLSTVVQREQRDGTYKPRRRDLLDQSFGKGINEVA